MTSHPVRLLVVGGNGFIGRHVVERGVACGWQVTSLSRSLPATPGHGTSAAHMVVADIADAEQLRSALGEAAFDYVVNCGGSIDHTPLSRGGRSVLDCHFGGVLNLVQTVDRRALRAFVNIGSSDEYGDAPAPQSETAREAPISPYSLGKAAATHLLQMLHRTEGIPAITLRLFLTYGPGQDARRFVPQVVRGCLEDRTFPASAGEQIRDFCFVDDTVAAVFAALRAPAAHGEVINVASGVPVAIREVIETVRRLVGKGTPRFGDIPYRPGESMALYANISRARSLLDWQPTVPLVAGLERVIRSLGGER